MLESSILPKVNCEKFEINYYYTIYSNYECEIMIWESEFRLLANGVKFSLHLKTIKKSASDIMPAHFHEYAWMIICSSQLESNAKNRITLIE